MDTQEDRWDRQLARVRFSKIYSRWNRTIEWADGVDAPIHYQLACNCMHNWVDVDRLHDKSCALADLHE